MALGPEGRQDLRRVILVGKGEDARAVGGDNLAQGGELANRVLAESEYVVGKKGRAGERSTTALVPRMMAVSFRPMGLS